MITTAKFIAELAARFSEMQPEFAAEAGLDHMQIHVFARHTQGAIDAGRLDTVAAHFRFAEKAFRDATPHLENALSVSYLEHLDFAGPYGPDAQRLLPRALRQGWRDITAYNEQFTKAEPSNTRRRKNA